MLSVVSIYPNDYKPLTDEEVEIWLRSVSLEQLIVFIQMYDYIEKASAEIILPSATYILADSDLYISYEEPVRIEIAHLRYEFELEDTVIENFQVDDKKENRRKNILTGIAIGVASFLGGGLTVALISK